MKTDSNLLAVSAGLRAAVGYYRLVAEIGRGGMASVYLALLPNGDGTSRKIVLKQLHPEFTTDEDFRVMFEDEARVATRLHHDNVVETYDVYADRDLCVLVMEFLDGQTLARIRQRAGRLGGVPSWIHLRVLAELLNGLHYVHELTDANGSALHIVHRDITPSNVFVTYDGRVKIVDFGIAKATTSVAHTRMGVLKGKLAYMSPESVRGERVDRRSDVFSVGVMLWEAATGLRFWQNHDEVGVFRRLLMGDLPVHPRGAPLAHREVLRIAERALAVDPSERYASADEMKQEIEEVLRALGQNTSAPVLSAYIRSSFVPEREKLDAIVAQAMVRSSTRPVSRRSLLGGDLCDSYSGIERGRPSMTCSTVSAGSLRTTSCDVLPDAEEAGDDVPRRHGFILAAAAAATLAVTVAFFAQMSSSGESGWLAAVLRPPTAAGAPNARVAGAHPSGASPSADRSGSSATVAHANEARRNEERSWADLDAGIPIGKPATRPAGAPPVLGAAEAAADRDRAAKDVERTAPATTSGRSADGRENSAKSRVKKAPTADDPWGI